MGYKFERPRCDNERREQDNKLFTLLFAGSKTSFELCPPYAHHNNGVAECMISTISEKARAMLIESQAPVNLWAEVVLTVVYFYRRTPNSGLTNRDNQDGYKAPYETPTKFYKIGRAHV